MSKNAAAKPLVWILLGYRHGDNNQLVALAEAVGLPFEPKHLTFNRLRHFAFLRGKRLLHVTRQARRMLAPPWPDLVIGLGYDSMPVARRIREMSGDRTRLVQIGNPRTNLADIDLVLTTPQYSLGDASNVVILPFPVGNPAQGIVPTSDEERWLSKFPRPRRLVAVGGSTRQWQLDIPELERTIQHLQSKRADHGGSVIVVTSRRTPDEVRSCLEQKLTGPNEAKVDNFPRFAILLAEADQCYVTADSVSMLSEAILTGKPVGMIPIKRSFRGRLGYWLRGRGLKLKSHADLSKFWDYLIANQLVGTVANPIASKVGDSINTAADAVRKIVDRKRQSR